MSEEVMSTISHQGKPIAFPHVLRPVLLILLALLVAASGFCLFFYWRHPKESLMPKSQPLPAPLAAVPIPFQIPKLIEAETLKVGAKNREFGIARQSTTGWTQNLSGEAHVFAQTNLGDWIEFDFPAEKPGKNRVTAYFTKNGDYGVVKVSVNGKVAKPALDLSSPIFVGSGPIVLGEFNLVEHINNLRIEVIGKGRYGTAPFFQFGIDGIQIDPIF